MDDLNYYGYVRKFYVVTGPTDTRHLSILRCWCHGGPEILPHSHLGQLMNVSHMNLCALHLQVSSVQGARLWHVVRNIHSAKGY